MTDREPELERREIRMPDGRRLVYYPYPGTGERLRSAAGPTPSPPREER